MIQAVPQIHQTSWESLPTSIRPPVLTTLQKIWRIVWNILSVLIPIIGLVRLAAYGIGRLATRAILPATYLDEDEKELSRLQLSHVFQLTARHYEATPYTVVTPDGAALSAIFFRHLQGNAETPTLIYFSGNAELKGLVDWEVLMREPILHQTPMNIVAFDYRNTGESTGELNHANDLIVDGCSIVDWVKRVFKTPDEKIIFYGKSLGGAIALKTKASDERLNGKLVNERSFSSLSDWIRAHPSLNWISEFAVMLLKNQELDLDAAKDYGKLMGEKLFIFHKQDPVIFSDASMARLVPYQETFELRERGPVDNHHCARLTEYEGATEKISEFIFTN